MGILKYIAVLIIVAIGAFFLGKSQSDPVEKIVEVEVVKERTNTVEVVREVKKPDGTTIKETRKEEVKQRESEVAKTVEPKLPQYGLSIMAGNFQDPYYGVLAERKIFKNVKAGVWGNTRQEFGVSVGFEF